ncbi:MAG: glutathione S-transferase family protein [Nevskia sp.]|jgi:glutathione S-transferase|nr:glutathione S-transferase family protein [Nevskia sp.]
MKLVIGNKNYSSWSLRPWLALKVAEIPFEEILIPLYQADSKARQLAFSPAGKVPILVDGAVTIWDSLAILEYVAEQYPDRGLWPRAIAARAHARSVSAEMHAGFAALRTAMPMNCRATLAGKGHTPEALADIARIAAIWGDCRARYGNDGPFLFGAFSNADAFYAPVVTRFLTYGVALPDVCRAYVNTVRALPAMREWYAAADVESERLAHSEIYAMM